VEPDGFIWRFTGFYGEPKSNQKDLFWKVMRTLSASRRRLWLCVGDFNEVLLGYEKEGGQPKAQGCMDRFREALDDCSLTDLGFIRDPFTWRNNCHNSDNYIRECLDRAVADDAWCSRFSNFRVINGDPRHSDHRPIIVEVNEEMRSNVRPGGKAFRFEAGWIQEEHCKTIVENAWNLTIGVRAGSVIEAV